MGDSSATMRYPIPMAIVVSMCAGCVAPAPPEPPRPPEPPPPKILVEEEIRPVERPDLVILEVKEEPKSDGQVEVVGTVLNRGPGTARNLVVTVHLLDAGGNELAVLPAEVSRATLEANATASFRLATTRPPTTASYHVVAVAQ